MAWPLSSQSSCGGWEISTSSLPSTPTSFPSFPSQGRERTMRGDRQTDRKRESRQRPCECVSYGTDLVLITLHTQPSSLHSVPTLCHPHLPPLAVITPSWPVSSLWECVFFSPRSSVSWLYRRCNHSPIWSYAARTWLSLILWLELHLSHKNERFSLGLRCLMLGPA